MSKNRDDDYVATKVEKSFDDDGNTVVAELPKSKMKDEVKVKEIKSEVKPGVNKLLDSKQKPAKVINLNKKK